jgi:ABC-type nickel/cobalt efflux system permease component RcnA
MAAMSAGKASRRTLIMRGSLWGLGHTITLLSICGILLIWGGTISTRMQAVLQLIVGVMIMFLGANVLYRLWRQRPHFHIHQHAPDVKHLHAHTHVGETLSHAQNRHLHKHQNLGMGRAVMVGMIHGTAGSAGLLVLAASTDSVMNAMGYVLAFGTGSIFGMAALSFVASYPLGFLEKGASWVNTAAITSVGAVALIIGLRLFVENWSVL